ncbi:Rv3235 family protein [Prescottella subtropica]|uniref:Rv3235 family protein n=1 Tax=Prescottella subtropica TaxID=2545757 RepID=UPI001F4F77E9|nr:Rv3235 family protein [Prescottella subtropica]
MDTAPRFLSRAPRFEPPTAESTDAPVRCGPLSSPVVSARRSPHDGRSPRRARPAVVDASDAHRFAEHALRLALEIIDRRRPPAQLRTVASPAVVDVVHYLIRSAPTVHRLGTASRVRVHIRPVRPGAAEVFGTYNRSGRVFAVAARIERGPDDHPADWTITSLQIA